MNRFNLLSVLILLSITNLDLLAQRDRNVVWVHGRGEDDDFWKAYAAAFEADYPRMNAINETYDTDAMFFMGYGSPSHAGITAQSPANSIAVGHSMGGVAIAGDISRENPNQYKGIITVGSPLRGARIVNAHRSGELGRALERGTKALVAGPVWFDVIIGNVVAKELMIVLKDKLAPDDINNASAWELQEGSVYLNRLANHIPTIPHLAIWGNENRPVLWRFAGTASEDITSGILRNMYEAKMVRTVKQIQAIYLAFAISYAAKAVANIFVPFVGWVAAAWDVYRADQWRRGYNYLRHNAESDWNNLIGATGTEQRERCDMQSGGWYCDDPDRWRTCYYRPERQVCYKYTHHFSGESDGFISKHSQIGEYTQFAKGDYDEREAVGANHLEQNRHREVKKWLKAAFDGDIHEKFKINIK